MTPATMIAVMVILVAFLVALVITAIFCVIDTFYLKNCHHLCFFCKYKHRCDWYENKKHPLQ